MPNPHSTGRLAAPVNSNVRPMTPRHDCLDTTNHIGKYYYAQIASGATFLDRWNRYSNLDFLSLGYFPQY